VARPELQRAPDRCGRRGGGEEARDGVGDEREVATGVQRSEPQRLAGERLRDDRRDHRAGRLMGPVGVERPHHGHRQLVGPVPRVHQPVGRRLAGGVGRRRLDRVRRGDRHRPGAPVDLARRGVDHAPRSAVQRGLRHVERAGHVGLEEVARVDERVRDRDLGAEVEDRLHAVRGLLNGLDVAQVAEHDVDLARELGVEPVERPAVVARVVADEGAHARALAHEPRDEVAADESACARDEHGLTAEGHPLILAALPRPPGDPPSSRS
jgi:hypothetical protein